MPPTMCRRFFHPKGEVWSNVSRFFHLLDETCGHLEEVGRSLNSPLPNNSGMLGRGRQAVSITFQEWVSSEPPLKHDTSLILP